MLAPADIACLLIHTKRLMNNSKTIKNSANPIRKMCGNEFWIKLELSSLLFHFKQPVYNGGIAQW